MLSHDLAAQNRSHFLWWREYGVRYKRNEIIITHLKMDKHQKGVEDGTIL
jgi:hypothetical protein